MKKGLLKIALSVLGAAFFLCAKAQGVPGASIHPFVFEDVSILTNISNNGKWATAHGTEESKTMFPKLIDLSSNQVTELLTGEDYSNLTSAAYDVTDDGSMVAGSYDGQPAIYITAQKRWSMLAVPDSCVGGEVTAITPDGHYAVGRGQYADTYMEAVVMWDLQQDGLLLDLSGIPFEDMVGENNNQRRLIGVTPDGNKVLGCISYSYVSPAGIFFFVYDRQTKKCQPIGFDTTTETTEEGPQTVWTPRAEGLYFINSANLSANGRYITGEAYMENDAAKGYVYDIETDKFTLYSDAQDDMPGFTACSNGIVLGATPPTNPYRDWSVRVGEYWYPISLILSQRYGINFSTETNFSNTGTPIATSLDGKKIVVFVAPQKENYILELPETLDAATTDIDLLGNYIVNPKAGSEFSSLKTVTFTFPYEIELLGDKSNVTFTDENGKKTGTILSLKTDDKDLNISFRSTNLQAGVKYTLTLSAGTIAIKGDTERKNKELSVTYTGRDNVPVKMVSATPYENTEVKQLNYTNNPITITFDTQLSLNEEAIGYLYKDAETTPDGTLRLGVTDNKLYVFPVTARNLFKGHNYKVTVPRNAVYDIMGNNGNDSITLHYIGGFEREVSYDNDTLFVEDFNNGFTKTMLYEGDHNKPTEEMQKMDFNDSDNYPWTMVRDEDDPNNYAAASTSLYDPVGRSDDWMVTAHIYIPDDRCYLQFDAQSFRENKKDSLYVLVWVTEDEFSSMNSERIAKFKAECDTIYAGIETPGDYEDFLAGDWTEHTASLQPYAGKNIYIAFVNSNENQSCVFVDNLLVRQDQQFQISVTTDQTVVKAKEIKISGQIRITTPDHTYSTLELTLKDSQGNMVDQISESNLELKENDKYDFSFDKPLPLVIGQENEYTILVQLDEEQSEPHYSVKNLSFQTVKRVVLEEGTGQDCPNCPQGILAIENLEDVYGDLFIPVSLHTYSGDPYGTGFESYAAFLNITGYPSGTVNRTNQVPVGAMTSDENGNATFTSTAHPCWLDYVAAEMEISADANFDIAKAKVEADSTINMTYKYQYALNVKGQNVNLFTVILEDSLIGKQRNSYGSNSDPLLGEWGQGGKYSAATVRNYPFVDVVRGVVGDTFYGTAGYIQPNVEAGKEYTAEATFKLPAKVLKAKNCKIVTMMIDANSGKVINSARAKLDVSDFANAIADIQAEKPNVEIAVVNGGVEITTDAPAQINLYSLNGTLIGTAKSQGFVSLSTNGYRGLTLVKVTTGHQTLVKKVIVK